MSDALDSANFYAGLPVLTHFSAVTDTASFVPLPADWQVATCDVRNSTLAVQAGHYKHVNTVTLPALTPALDAKRLGNEVGVRAADRGRFGKRLYLMRARWLVILGRFLMKIGLKTEQTDWSRYKETLVRNTDVRKFNDIYRQILAGNAAQREALEAWLAERYAKRELVYGLHVTDRAQMTCLVFNYSGRHLHFIDGADGGLFLAAKQFKERAAKLIAV